MDLPGEQLAGSERLRFDRETGETFDSTSTSAGSEKRNEVLGIQMLKLRLNEGRSNASPSSATIGEKGEPTHKRATHGRRQFYLLHWLTAYHVLISIVLLINLGILVSQLIVDTAVEAPLTATATNIMAAVLLRQEELVNLSFKLVSKLPPTLPLRVRKKIGDFHHYGGVHVGCALSALCWYIMFTYLNTVRVLGLLSLRSMTTILYTDIITAYIALFVVLVVCLASVPWFRVRFHNTFEVTHRFGGWATLLVLWIHAGITSLTPDASVPLYAHPTLWFLALTTFLLVLPWLRMRRVPITAYPISARELQLTFPHSSMPHISTLRFSTAPLIEWHAFATVPVNCSTSNIIVSKAGDWTASIIENPPTHMWVRNPPVLNFLAFVPLFRDVLLVATGAGVAPCLSLLASPAVERMKNEGRRVRVLWCVADPYTPHWGFVVDAIREVDAQAVIFNSKVARPDVAFEARWLAVKEGIEAVFVISNPKLTKKVVRECKGAGLAAYGAVFDS